MNTKSHAGYGQAFGLGFLCLFVILLPLVILDKGYFIYYGDFVSQQLPFYQHANEVIRNGGLLGWDWGTDLGSSFLGSYAFYLTGSPFFWVTMILPEQWVLFAIPWLLCLKHGFASMTAYGYIRRFVRSEQAAVIGGLLYAFSGFQLFNLFFNHFQDVTAFFPLMLTAMEEHINHHKKGWFAASVALMAVINYFFFAGQAVFLIIYFLIRCKCSDFHVNFRNFLTLFAEAVIGVCLACIVLIPAALAVLDNNRVSEYLFGQNMIFYSDKTRIMHIIQSFFMVPDPPARTILFSSKNAKWSSIGGYLPLYSMAGVTAFMHQKKGHWANRLILICMFCAFVPVLNSMFYMFNASYYARWYYMPILIMAMMTAHALDNREIKWKHGLLTCTVMMGIFAVIFLLPTKNDNDEIEFLKFATIPSYFCVEWLVSVLCLIGNYYLCILRKQKKQFQQKALILTSVACMLCTGTIVYFGKVIGTDAKHYISEAIQGREKLSISYDTDDADYFRVDISKDYDNYPMFWGLSSMRCFQSVVSPSIMEFYDSIGETRDVASRPETDLYTLRGLFSVKYYFNKLNQNQEEINEFDMPGFSYDRTENGFAIYKNDYFLPMGFTYDKYLTPEDLTDKTDSMKEKILIHALILTPEQAETYQNNITKISNPDALSLGKGAYLNACKAHAKEICQNFSYDANGFSAEITLDKPKLVFFSIPFDTGWTAEINGKPAVVENVSGGFTAILCEAGENQIRFAYTLPGLKAGSIITMIGILLFLVYLLRPFSVKEKKYLTDEHYLSAEGVSAAEAYLQHVLSYAEHQKGETTNEPRTSERNET